MIVGGFLRIAGWSLPIKDELAEAHVLHGLHSPPNKWLRHVKSSGVTEELFFFSEKPMSP